MPASLKPIIWRTVTKNGNTMYFIRRWKDGVRRTSPIGTAVAERMLYLRQAELIPRHIRDKID